MKETRLGDFEETILLLVGILGDDAYALRTADEFATQTGRTVSIGAVHSTLSRLEEKGFVTSAMGRQRPSGADGANASTPSPPTVSRCWWRRATLRCRCGSSIRRWEWGKLF